MKKSSHLGVYGCIYSTDLTALLVIKKIRGPYQGLYDLPGGSMEEDELLEETLVREVLEETGCTVTHWNQIGAYAVNYTYQDPNGLKARLRHIGILYQAQITGTPNLTGDGQDSGGALWIPIKTLNPTNATPFTCQAAFRFTPNS